MKTAATYARVSTAAQADQGTSLSTQREACRQYAEERGYTVIEEVSEDISGAVLERPGLDRLRDMAAAAGIDAVVVFDPDRLTRSLAHLYLLSEEFERAGVQLLFVNVPRDSTPEGQMLFGMRGLFAEYERAKIKERTRRGKDRRAREGTPVGTWMQAYGYRYVPVQERARAIVKGGNGTVGSLEPEQVERVGSYEIVPHEAEVVRQMFTWCVQEKLTLYAIVMRLRDMGIRTKRHGDWSLSTVQRILRNDVYLGNGYWNRTVEKGKRRTDKWSRRTRDPSEWIHFAVPQIIERDLWEAAQRQLDENGSESPRNLKRFYLLRGMVFCVRCGRRYQSMSGDGHRAYRCPFRTRVFYVVDERRCENTNFNAIALERKVWEVVTSYITDPSRFYKEPPEQIAAAEQEIARSREAGLQVIESALKNLDIEESRMIAAYRVGAIDLAQLQDAVQDIRKRRGRHLEERNALACEGDPAAATGSRVHSLETLEETRQLALRGVDANTDQGKRALLELMQVRIYVDGRQLRLTGLFLHDLVIEW